MKEFLFVEVAWEINKRGIVCAGVVEFIKSTVYFGQVSFVFMLRLHHMDENVEVYVAFPEQVDTSCKLAQCQESASRHEKTCQLENQL